MHGLKTHVRYCGLSFLHYHASASAPAFGFGSGGVIDELHLRVMPISAFRITSLAVIVVIVVAVTAV